MGEPETAFAPEIPDIPGRILGGQLTTCNAVVGHESLVLYDQGNKVSEVGSGADGPGNGGSSQQVFLRRVNQ